jgi:hypothetical protein
MYFPTTTFLRFPRVYQKTYLRRLGIWPVIDCTWSKRNNVALMMPLRLYESRFIKLHIIQVSYFSSRPRYDADDKEY